MNVAIYTDDGARGTVHYIPSTKEVMVYHPDAKISRRVRAYLNLEKEFSMPASKERGSKIAVIDKPNRNISFMEMGLCEMYHSIGVHVDWGDENNQGGSTENIQTGTDNPFLKSIDDFDIIN